MRLLGDRLTCVSWRGYVLLRVFAYECLQALMLYDRQLRQAGATQSPDGQSA